MEVIKSERGFEWIRHPKYVAAPVLTDRLVSQSSAIGDYKDAWNRPGSSFLWVGDNQHLSRDEVRELIGHLQSWVDTGSLGPTPHTETSDSTPPGGKSIETPPRAR
jgi:hypothetical protein